MLPKRERLSRKDFDRFFKTGRRYQNEYYTLVYTAHPSFHASVVVPAKVEKRATRRNKIRRRVYDIVRHCVDVRERGGVCIVLVKSPALTASYDELKLALEALLDKVTADR